MCPTPMEKAPNPDLGYELIPKERYTSPEFACREWERMWTKVWLLAGRESDLRAAGDYFTFEIGLESILVVRQPDGSLAASYNVCMHRGNRLRSRGAAMCRACSPACSTAGSTASTAACCRPPTRTASRRACRTTDSGCGRCAARRGVASCGSISIPMPGRCLTTSA